MCFHRSRGVVFNIYAFHADAPGSIPGDGGCLLFVEYVQQRSDANILYTFSL